MNSCSRHKLYTCSNIKRLRLLSYAYDVEWNSFKNRKTINIFEFQILFLVLFTSVPGLYIHTNVFTSPSVLTPHFILIHCWTLAAVFVCIEATISKQLIILLQFVWIRLSVHMLRSILFKWFSERKIIWLR